jgi:hypothetical protein
MDTICNVYTQYNVTINKKENNITIILDVTYIT